jgi:clan AA aspartic protease (TIGR02281 family)
MSASSIAANAVRAACLLLGLTASMPSAAAAGAPTQAGTGPTSLHKTAACGAVSDRPIALESASNFAFVTVLANNMPLRLILDLGAERTVLTTAAAQRIGGKVPEIQFRRGLNGVGGSLPSREIELTSFTVGGVDIPWRRLRVAPFALPTASIDGLLGTDVLGKFDIDLDLPNRRMSLYEKGKCIPDWVAADAGIKIGRSALNDHVFFPVLLDGRKITAMIDTGAQRTTLSAATARAIGITEAALAQDQPVRTRGFGNGQLASRLHRFASLTVGRITLANPEIVITDLRVRGIDMVLGMDFLQSRRLFLSYAGFRMFISDMQGRAPAGTASRF